MKRISLPKVPVPRVINSPVLLVALAVSLTLASGVSNTAPHVVAPAQSSGGHSSQSLTLQKTQVTSDSAEPSQSADTATDDSPSGSSTKTAPSTSYEGQTSQTSTSTSLSGSTQPAALPSCLDTDGCAAPTGPANSPAATCPTCSTHHAPGHYSCMMVACPLEW